jgi:hypothetical protein
MTSHSVFVVTLVPGLLLLIASSEGFCQLPTPDSTSARRDSGQVSTDTVVNSRPDSSLRDSTAIADTANIKLDTLRPRTNATPMKPDTAARVKSPSDSILNLACGGAAGSRTTALDLLVVVFAPDATAEERAAASAKVGGKLVGSPEAGTFYLRVPTKGDEYRLRAAADELSLLPQVRQVGNRACPPPSPAKAPPIPQPPAAARTDRQPPASSR